MNPSSDIFSKFTDLSDQEREELIAKYNQALSLAMYQLILAELQEKDKEAFEKASEKKTDGDTLLFGYEHITDFEKKYKALMAAITDVFLNQVV